MRVILRTHDTSFRSLVARVAAQEGFELDAPPAVGADDHSVIEPAPEDPSSARGHVPGESAVAIVDLRGEHEAPATSASSVPEAIYRWAIVDGPRARAAGAEPRSLEELSTADGPWSSILACGFDDILVAPILEEAFRFRLAVAARRFQRHGERSRTSGSKRAKKIPKPRPKKSERTVSSVESVFGDLPEGILVHHETLGILYVNEALRRLLGYESANELFSKPATTIVHPNQRAFVVEGMRLVRKFGSVPPRFVTLLRADGTSTEAETRGMLYELDDVSAILVMIRGVTTQRRAEQALAEGERRFRTLIENMSVGVLLFSRNAEIIAANRAAADMLGVSEHELLGSTPRASRAWELFDEDGAPLAFEDFPVNVAVRTRKPVRDRLVAMTHNPSEARSWILMSVEPQLDTDGNILELICTLTDMTEQLRAHVQLVHSQRLASMGRLAVGLAHEINNPLSTLLINLELAHTLASASPDDGRIDGAKESLRELAKESIAAAERIRAVVRDLRTFSRTNDQDREPVDMNEAIERACTVAAHEVRHRARLVKRLTHVPPVRGSEASLAQLAFNLIVHAALSLSEDRADENEICVATRPDGRDVLFEVSHTGPGLAPSSLERVFDPFFFGQISALGGGLGLASSRAIVTSLGGKIGASNTEGGGTIFHARLPTFHSQAPSAAGRGPPKVFVLDHFPKRLLLIDDDPQVLRSLSRMLANLTDVVARTSARAALALVQSGEVFDGILCDIMMPEMGGIEFFNVLSSASPEHAARTLFMSGGVTTERTQAFVKEHAARCMDKPFNKVQIAERFADLLGDGESIAGEKRCEPPRTGS